MLDGSTWLAARRAGSIPASSISLTGENSLRSCRQNFCDECRWNYTTRSRVQFPPAPFPLRRSSSVQKSAYVSSLLSSQSFESVFSQVVAEGGGTGSVIDLVLWGKDKIRDAKVIDARLTATRLKQRPQPKGQQFFDHRRECSRKYIGREFESRPRVVTDAAVAQWVEQCVSAIPCRADFLRKPLRLRLLLTQAAL